MRDCGSIQHQDSTVSMLVVFLTKLTQVIKLFYTVFWLKNRLNRLNSGFSFTIKMLALIYT